jgi:hypothetical protein
VPPFALQVEALMYRYFRFHITLSLLESLVSLVSVVSSAYKNSKEENYFKRTKALKVSGTFSRKLKI